MAEFLEIDRPSIHELQKRNKVCGGFRATTYDKSAKSHAQTNTDIVLRDLLVCQITSQSLLMLSSDYELS